MDAERCEQFAGQISIAVILISAAIGCGRSPTQPSWDGQVRVAGSVVEFQTNAAINGARVTIGEATATTDPRGAYSLTVPTGEQRVSIDGELLGVVNMKDRTYRGDFYVRVTGCIARCTSRVEGQADVPLSLDRLTLTGVLATSVRHDNRPAIRLIESDSSRSTLGLAIVNGVTFRDGTIEVDVAGRRGPYAVPDDRGFIGIAFRVTANAERLEYVYLRPDNGRAPDQVRRNHSTQYSSHPDFPWPRMRKEFPEKYESYVDLEPGVWTHMRIVVSGTSARLFMHAAAQPALVVNDLKLGASEGGIALWIGAGTEGFFSNLRHR